MLTINRKEKPLAWIEEQVMEIMINFGPDGHTDGSEIITQFIVAILTGKEDEFITQLQKDIEKKEKRWEKYQKRNK